MPVVVHVLRSIRRTTALCGLTGGTLKEKARFARDLPRAERWVAILESDGGPRARVCDVCAWNAAAAEQKARDRADRKAATE